MFQVFGFFMILAMYLQTRSISGVSLHSLVCYLVVYIFRAVSITLEPGFLPEDASGDWFYHAMEFLGAGICVALIVLLLRSEKYEYESYFDSFKCYFIIAAALIAALIVRPRLSRVPWMNFIWTFAFYVETFAIIPQMMFFVNKVDRDCKRRAGR